MQGMRAQGAATTGWSSSTRRAAGAARSRRSTSRGDWGVALGEVPALGDVPTGGLRSCSTSPATAAAHRPAAGDASHPASSRPERETGTLDRRTACTLDPPRARRASAVSVGDVVYVEPIDGKPGSRLRQVPEIEGAIVAMDPHTGRVLAMVGGFSYAESRVQPRDAGAAPAGLVVQAVRLFGGARQRLHAVVASCSTRRSRSIRAPGRVWRPENYDGKFYGPRRCAGIEKSRNVMTVRLAQDMSACRWSPNTPALRRLRRHAAVLCRCRSAPARRRCCA